MYNLFCIKVCQQAIQSGHSQPTKQTPEPYPGQEEGEDAPGPRDHYKTGIYDRTSFFLHYFFLLALNNKNITLIQKNHVKEIYLEVWLQICIRKKIPSFPNIFLSIP